VAKQLREKFDAKISVSTDSDAIKLIAEKVGVLTSYTRPDYLATDAAGKADTIKDLLLYEESLVNIKYDYILDLDVTSPLRTLEDLERSFEILKNNKEALNLFSVNDAARNPYFNMVEKNNSGFYSLVKTKSDGSIMTRQSAPKVYDMNASFYWYRRSFFESNFNTAITNKSLIYKMNHTCFDLDHPIDFLFMEYLLENNKLDFQL
jgi:CMP-N-acetylneuraminic acid synthetase